ncbi:MAG: ABC transporter permease [Nitrososphaeria archaeon]
MINDSSGPESGKVSALSFSKVQSYILDRNNLQQYGPFMALVALFIVSSIASPSFFSLLNILNILRQISFVGIIALGMTFVIAGGGIDLSVGSMTALVGGLDIYILNALGGGLTAVFITFFAGIALGAAFGAFNGFVITKAKLEPFIVTLGTMTIFQSVILYISDAGNIMSNSLNFSIYGLGSFLGFPIPAWFFLALAVLFAFIMNQTAYGRYIRAIGSNVNTAYYSGIKVDKIKFLSYVIIGITVGVTAFLLASEQNSISSSNSGANYELDAIAAVIIGGTPLAGGNGFVIGTIAGAIILGIINNILVMLNVSPYLTGTVKGFIIIGAVLLIRKRT